MHNLCAHKMRILMRTRYIPCSESRLAKFVFMLHRNEMRTLLVAEFP